MNELLHCFEKLESDAQDQGKHVSVNKKKIEELQKTFTSTVNRAVKGIEKIGAKVNTFQKPQL